MDLMAAVANLVKSATEATGPSDAMETPGTMLYPRTRVLNRGNQTEIHLVCVQQRGTTRRHIEAEAEAAGLGLETVDQRPSVEVADGAKPNSIAGLPHETSVALDRLEACRANTSPNLLDRRAPPSFRLVVSCVDRVMIIGSKRERHLRELRAVQRPVNLNHIDTLGKKPRERDAPHVLVPGRRLSRIDGARQRRKRAETAEAQLIPSDLSTQLNPRAAAGPIERQSGDLQPGIRRRFQRLLGRFELVDGRQRDPVEPGLLQRVQHHRHGLG